MPLDPTHLKNYYCGCTTHTDMLNNSCQYLSCNPEGSIVFVIADSAADPQSQDSEMLKYRCQSDVQDDIYSLKLTYRPNVLSSYRLKNKLSSRFTLHSSLKKLAAFTLAEGATHVAHSHNIRKAAFTLAEVLITFGIIGVVAALTIPGMSVKYQKQIAAKRLEQTYSILSQAIVHAQTDYGDISSWGMAASTPNQNDPTQPKELIKSFADTYLIPYLKLLTKPILTSNIEYAGYKYPKTRDGREYMFTPSYILVLTNGVTLFMLYNGSTSVYTYPLIFVDINGKKGLNILGRDFFAFQFDGVNKMKLEALGPDTDRDRLKSYCMSGNGEKYENLYCTKLIMLDGWQIKDDYPW